MLEHGGLLEYLTEDVLLLGDKGYQGNKKSACSF